MTLLCNNAVKSIHLHGPYFLFDSCTTWPHCHCEEQGVLTSSVTNNSCWRASQCLAVLQAFNIKDHATISIERAPRDPVPLICTNIILPDLRSTAYRCKHILGGSRPFTGPEGHICLAKGLLTHWTLGDGIYLVLILGDFTIQASLLKQLSGSECCYVHC